MLLVTVILLLRTPGLATRFTDIPVAPGEEHYVLDPSLDEDSLL